MGTKCKWNRATSHFWMISVLWVAQAVAYQVDVQVAGHLVDLW